MLGGNPLLFLIGCVFLIPAIVVAVPAHELGHAWAAALMGDRTPRDRGYLPLRPRPLFNIYGVIAAFLANVSWGTPVPVNEYRLGGAARRVAYALAGPAANLAVAVVLGVVLRVLTGLGYVLVPLVIRQPADLLVNVVFAVFFLNLSTFAFQLLPFPGLDGWRVVEALFRSRNPRFFFSVSANVQTIWAVAVIAVLVGPLLLHFSVLDAAVGIFFQPTSSAILGQCIGYVSLDPCPLSVGS
jgi:Zn-dependent protease